MVDAKAITHAIGSLGLAPSEEKLHLAVAALKQFDEALGEAAVIAIYEPTKAMVADGRFEVDAFLPFLLAVQSTKVVSIATLDFCMFNWGGDEDHARAVFDVLTIIKQQSSQNTGALVGGLICLGDERVNKVIAPILLQLSEAEAEMASYCNTGFVSYWSLDAWLDWMEILIEKPDGSNDGAIGYVAAGFYRAATATKIDLIRKTQRNFGYMYRENEPGMYVIEEWKLDRLGDLFSERLRALELNEPEPKVLAHLITKLGISF